MQLGNLYLEGRGERGDNFRCSSFVGTALEGGDDPCVVGRFNMQLALPFNDELDMLEAMEMRKAAREKASPGERARARAPGVRARRSWRDGR